MENRTHWHRIGLVGLVGLTWFVFIGLLAQQSEQSIARVFSGSFGAWMTPAEDVVSDPPPEPPPVLRFSALGEDPQTFLASKDLRRSPYYNEFQNLLDRFIVRQGVDDNFTIRVYDNRSDKLLEVFELDSARTVFERTGAVNWAEVDRNRRRMTRRLVDKYEAANVPREHISVRWGRANQVWESYKRNQPYLEYELRLANWLDLSLLATQISTVETFNQPKLVSPSGARSRYQLMPYLMRKFGIEQYRLRTASGQSVAVHEEYHPLLTMEPAFYLVRAYSNAVGHEVPGISAYHTGPGNIFNLLRYFLVEHEGAALQHPQTVLDAYIWGLTDGFSVVKDHTSFGNYSRGYISAAYGSWQAVKDMPVDTTQTVVAELVQLRSGKKVLLDELLSAFQQTSLFPSSSQAAVYAAFRQLNPHIDLPKPVKKGIPTGGNIQLTDRSEGHPVRFFLPQGGSKALQQAPLEVIDQNNIRYFDDSTYRFGRYKQELTEWDRAYRSLIEHIKQFGFTEKYREQLNTIATHLKRLAEENPTPYRKAQARIVEIHQRMWSSNPWQRLADVVAARQGTYIVPPRSLDLPEQELPLSLDQPENNDG